MANNIKGITIEIGGKTTELDRALKSTEQKTQSLSKELKQINNQLKFDPHNAVLLQQKFDVLSQRVTETRTRLQALKEAQAQVEQQFKNGEIGEEEYRAFQREVALAESQLKTFEQQAEDAKKDLDNLGNETDQTGDEFKELGRDAQTSAKQVGDGFNTTAINMSSVMNIVSQIGNVIQSAIQGAINLGKKIAGIINDYYDAVDEINTNSAKYGISTDTYQKWKYASEIIDVSAETMGAALGKLEKQIGKSPEKFEKLGISIRTASGAYRDSEDIFYDAVDALGRIDDETEADILANDLFGKSFQELKPLIDAGTGSLKELGEQAEQRGAIMTPEELATMQQAKDALDGVRAQLAVALAPVIMALSPYIEQIATWIAEKLASPKVQELLSKVGEAMGKILEGIAQLIQDAIESGELERFIDWLIEELPDIAQFVLNIVGGIKDVLKAIKEVISFFDKQGQKLDEFAHDLAEGWAGVATSADSSIGQMEGSWFNMLSTSWGKFTNFFSNIGSEFQALPGKISKWLSGVGSAIANAFKNIKMPSPHFVGGNFNKWPPVLPSIKWYKEGGIFDSPSIIGVGEAGTEVVLPVEKLSGILRSAGIGGGGIVVNAPVQVVKELNDGEIARVGNRLSNIVGREFAKRTGGVL